ncbi:MAG: hypothetical protein WC473_03185 [Patescibacteria group bacterium]|jgi:hypothetical protein
MSFSKIFKKLKNTAYKPKHLRYYIGQEYVEDNVKIPVEIHAQLFSPGEISDAVINFDEKTVWLNQRGSIISITIREKLSKKLIEDIQQKHRGDNFIVAYIAEIMPYVNHEILNQRYLKGHFLIRTYSVMDISDLCIIISETCERILVMWPMAIGSFPPLVDLQSKFNRTYIRDLVDSMHAYFSGNYEDCIRKSITSIETFIKYHGIQVYKSNGKIDFKNTLQTHMNIVCPMNGENAANVIWEAYKIRNDIVHDGKRLDPIDGKRLGKRVTHLINEVYKNYGSEEDLKQYAFFLEDQFLSLEMHLGDFYSLNWLEKNKPF